MERKNTITFYMLFSFLAITVISGTAQPSFAQSPGTMFGVAGNGSPLDPGALVTINPITGAQTLVADSITPGGLSGIGIDSSGRIWTSTISGAGSSSSLVELNSITGSVISTTPILVGGITPQSFGDLAVQPGTDVLFAMSSNAFSGTGGSLYTIDTTTGFATLLGSSITRNCGLAFEPLGTLYCVEGEVHILNPLTGAVISSSPPTDIRDFHDGAGVRSDGTVFVTSNFGSPALLTVNPLTGAEVTIISPPTRSLSDVDFVPDVLVGGTDVSINQSALLLAGVQSVSMWMIPVILAGIGIGVFVIKRRK